MRFRKHFEKGVCARKPVSVQMRYKTAEKQHTHTVEAFHSKFHGGASAQSKPS